MGWFVQEAVYIGLAAGIAFQEYIKLLSEIEVVTVEVKGFDMGRDRFLIDSFRIDIT